MNTLEKQVESKRGKGSRSRATKLTAAAASIAAAAAITTAGPSAVQAFTIPLPAGASVTFDPGLGLSTDFTSITATPYINGGVTLPWNWGAFYGGGVPIGGTIGFWGGDVIWPYGWISQVTAFGINWPIYGSAGLGTAGCWLGACPSFSPPWVSAGINIPLGFSTMDAQPATVQTTAKAGDAGPLAAPSVSPMSTWSIHIPGLFGGSVDIYPSFDVWLGYGNGAGISGGIGGTLTLPWGWGGGSGSIDFGSASIGWGGARLEFPGGAIGQISAFGLYFPTTLWGDLGAIGVNWGQWPYWELPAAGISWSPATSVPSMAAVQSEQPATFGAVTEKTDVSPAPSGVQRTSLPEVTGTGKLPSPTSVDFKIPSLPQAPSPKQEQPVTGDAPATGGTNQSTEPTDTKPSGHSGPVSQVLDKISDAVHGLGQGGTSKSDAEKSGGTTDGTGAVTGDAPQNDGGTQNDSGTSTK